MLKSNKILILMLLISSATFARNPVLKPTVVESPDISKHCSVKEIKKGVGQPYPAGGEYKLKISYKNNINCKLITRNLGKANIDSIKSVKVFVYCNPKYANLVELCTFELFK